MALALAVCRRRRRGRDEAQILAPVSLHLDPLTKIPPLRAEFERQLKAHPLWDGRVCTLQVTAAAWHSIEVRMLASAKDSGDAWNLRCDLREGMLAWIAETMPESVVRHRALENLARALGDIAH